MNDPGTEEGNNLGERLLDNVEDPNEQLNDDLMAEPGEIVVDPLQAGNGLHGESQQPKYRDTPFAIGFMFHLVVIVFLAFSWGTSSLKSGYPAADSPDDDSESVSLSGILWLCLFTSLASIGISAAALEMMTRYAEELIQISLIASCAFLALLVLAMFASGAAVLAFVWLFLLVLTGLYAHSVWNRIPFAAANLRTGIAAIQTNYGVCILAYAVAFCGNCWLLLWTLAFMGVSYKEADCSDGVCKNNMDPISFILFILSYHWTAQVLKNILHCTVAGVVGTWWFAPQDAASVFSPGIQDSFRRSLTYSFGSICMGSLLVAVIRTLEQMVRNARQRGNGGMLLCILECLLSYIERFARYFNKWAFIYVGLYGYDYLTAGKKVLELFHGRGWTTIISDNLVSRTLSLVCVVIAGLSGLIGMLIAKGSGWATAILGDDADGVVFSLCFFVGLSMAFVMMSVVLSAVDTIIVSFAEAPGEFETNHPALSQQMKIAWTQVYPQECGF